MSGNTISTFVDHAVTISPDGYVSPLLITKAGTISLASGNSGAALTINDSPAIATITNNGLIQASPEPDSGNRGISVESRAKITNTGVIHGGNGYPTSYYYDGISTPTDGTGGAGIVVNSKASNSSIIDSGKIYGGSGGTGYNIAAYGGAGVDLSGATGVKLTVTRTGTIAGGYGGYARYGNYKFSESAGVIMGDDRLVNSGLIIGGAGGGLPSPASDINVGPFRGLGLIGGFGVQLYGGQVLNQGTIAGGAGGSLGENFGGNGGVGLKGAGSESGREAIIVNHGLIEGGAGGNGSYAGANGGIGVRISQNALLTNDGDIIGGAAGVGGVKGSADGGAGVVLFGGSVVNFGQISAGAGYGAGVIMDGGSVLNAGMINGSDGGAGVYLHGGNLRNAGQITGGDGGVGVQMYYGTLTNSGTISGAADAVVLDAQNSRYTGTLIVEKGAVFNGDVVANPANSDTLELSGTSAAALTGIGTQFNGFHKIAFASGARWTISGDTAGLASGQAITGFKPGDAITLTDAGASSGVVSVASAGVVSIDAGGVVSKLDIAGATVGETNFKFSNDTLTESARPAMAFLTPPAEATATSLAHPFSVLEVLQHFASAPAPASFSHACLPETPLFGASLDQFFAPHIDAVPIVTLQA